MPPILSYFRTKVRGLLCGTRIITTYACVVYATGCEFRGRNYVKGGRM